MTPTAAISSDLSGVLAPESADEFLREVYGRRFRMIKGSPGKFAALLPWADVNRVLEQHRLETPRLRLTREGKSIPADSYTSYRSNPRNTSRVPRLDTVALTKHLREGATLVLDAVDEFQPAVRRLAEAFERVFRVRVQVNAYAGWRTSHGFDLHWDDHDVFILQVSGRKHWKVYGMARRYPLARDVEPNKEAPSEVLWDDFLEDGDLLYIPRGWWHVAMPLDEPTLHLTVGVNNPTGADLLNWFVDRLLSDEIVRRDLPHLHDGVEYAKQLHQTLLTAWTPSIVEEYLADCDAKAMPRPSASLPWAATECLLPPEYRVRWNGARNVPLRRKGEEIHLDAHACHWRFAASAEPLLKLLVSGHEISSDEIRHCGVPRADLFVKELIRHGLIIPV